MKTSIVSHKGGVGKTTSAMHLTSWIAGNLGKTLLVDGDPNRSVSLWKENGQGSLPCALASPTHAAVLSEPFEHLVFETQARPEHDDLKILAQGVDLIVIPTTLEDLVIDAAMLSVGKLFGWSRGIVLAVTHGGLTFMSGRASVDVCRTGRGRLVNLSGERH